MSKEPKILIVNPVITCGQCQKSQIKLPHQVDVGGMSQGEVFDGMLPMVQPMGWTLIGKPGERKFACPACLETARELERQQIHSPSGECVHFEVDPFRKRCLLDGVDEIGVTRAFEPQVLAFESNMARERPWL